MKSLKLLLSLLGVSVVLAACAPISLKNEQEPAGIKGGLLEISETPMLARHGKAVDMLFFSPENRLVLRRADGSEQVLSETAEKEARLAYASLYSDGPGLYALWRPKLGKTVDGVGEPGDKLVYFRASLDGGKTFGPLQRLNQKGGAFKPYMASNGNGDLYVAWTDERNSASNIDIYLNTSHDRGANWKKDDFKINGAESKMALSPSVVADGDRAYVSWMTVEGKQFKIFVRASEDRGDTWLPPVPAYTSLVQSATPQLVKTTAGLLLCWGDADAVRCTRSADHGKSWSNSVAVPDSLGTAGLLLQADPKGRAHLLIARKPEDDRLKVNLFHAVSEDGGTFSAPQRVSGGVPYASSTLLPVLTFGDDGSVLAVWVDMRYLRPVIAANYSVDGGKTWPEKDIVLAAKKGMYQLFPTVSYAGGGKYSIAWQESANRREPGSMIGQTVYHPGATGVVMPPPDMARLKARTDEFWRLREQGKWDQLFDYMDPYFRDINSRKGYVSSQGSVTYYSHRLIGEPELIGNRAIVKLAYESEVPELTLKGKVVSVPRSEVEIPQEWVWMDGDWYQVFRDLFNVSALPE